MRVGRWVGMRDDVAVRHIASWHGIGKGTGGNKVK